MFCWQNNNLPFLVLVFLWTPNVLRVLVYCSLLWEEEKEEVGTLLLFTFGLVVLVVVVVVVVCGEHGGSGLLCGWPLPLLLINGGHFTDKGWLWWGMKVLWLEVLISRLIFGDWNHCEGGHQQMGFLFKVMAQWAEWFFFLVCNRKMLYFVRKISFCILVNYIYIYFTSHWWMNY